MRNLGFAITAYHRSRQILDKLFAFVTGCFNGFWLGIFSRDALNQMDERYYNDDKMYREKQYNRSGLFGWEKGCLERYFSGRRRILVIGAGGGREVIALFKYGYDVDGYECNPSLVKFANELLMEENLPACIHLIDRDRAPTPQKQYDGVIIGWGAYMLIQGRQRRIAFLRQLRENVISDSPMLISFFHRRKNSLHFRLIPAVGNIFRWFSGRENIELGDDMVPEYVHYFTEQEIASEVRQAGFQLMYYATNEYGHAVAFARQN